MLPRTERNETIEVMETNEQWDVVVVGGGAAGLSAALVLGRARQRTLVVDAGSPSNGVAHGIGGLLGHDGRPPSELYATGRGELARYPAVEVRTGTVIGGVQDDAGFRLALGDGDEVLAERVLLATGMDYRRPELPGVEERWGRSVFHCPFCHGWEVHDRALGVLDRGASAVHRALLLRTWSDDVTVYADGPSGMDDAEARSLVAAGVQVVEHRIEGLRGPGSDLEAMVFADGSEAACQGLLVPVVLHQRSDLATQLGAELAEPGMLAADAIAVDAMLRTSVTGLYAAGDVDGEMPAVARAIASGSLAAASIVRDQVEQRAAVAA
jgi:thioredoxin reductase